MIIINGKRVTNPIAEGLVGCLAFPLVGIVLLVVFGLFLPVIFGVLLPLIFAVAGIAIAVSLIFPNKKK